MWQISDLEQDTRLDGAVSAGQRVARFIRPGKVRDVLHGVWLGHPLHPMLIQATIGTWLSASILDFAGGDQKAARRLVTAGLAVAAPAALAGAADWSEQHEQQMRVGVVHGVCCGWPAWRRSRPAGCSAVISPSAWPAARITRKRSRIW